MNLFALNVTLAVVWAALWADFSLFQLFVGFLVGFGGLWLAQPLFNKPSSYFLRAYRVIRLIIYFLYELILSSFRVAWDVVTPTHLSRACRNACGKSASRLLADRVHFEARRMLQDTDMTVSEISRRLGFRSAAYFTRAFQGKTGLTPTAFRRSA